MLIRGHTWSYVKIISPNTCSRYAKLSYLSMTGLLTSGSSLSLTLEAAYTLLENMLPDSRQWRTMCKMSAGYESKVASSLMLCNLVSPLELCTVQWQFGYPRCLFLTELNWDKLGFSLIYQRPSAVPSPFLSDLCTNMNQTNSRVGDKQPKESPSPNSNTVLI